MPETTCDVLVVGAGLMGCSAAFHLVRRGLRPLVVERREAPGRETTARSGAIIRAHYGVPELVALARDAGERFLRFSEEVGEDCGFVRSGYAVLADAEDAGTLRACVAMQQELGVRADLLEPAALKEIVPPLRTDDVALAAWEPYGGFADPAKTVAAYAGRARSLGAAFRFGAPVTAARPAPGGGWEVTLADGDCVSAGQVALCTGNWSRPVGALFGLDLPVTPVRAQIVVLERPASFAGTFPVISDLANLAYFRADGPLGMWVGSSDMADLAESLPAPEGYDESADPPAIEAARRKAATRFRGMDDPATAAADKGGVLRAFSGLYETTPDWQPVLETHPAAGLHVAVGFSGHGFKLSPVVGEAIAAWAAGEPPAWDLGLFSGARFAAGRPIRSQFPYRRARFLR